MIPHVGLEDKSVFGKQEIVAVVSVGDVDFFSALVTAVGFYGEALGAGLDEAAGVGTVRWISNDVEARYIPYMENRRQSE